MERSRWLGESLRARRVLAALGFILGSACLFVQLRPAVRSHWAVTAMAALFACYSLATLVFRWEGRPGSDLLALVGETIFFLVFASFAASSSAWLAAAIYAHTLISTMFFHSWWDTWLVAAVCTGVLAVTHGRRVGDELWLVVAWSSLLACVGAVHKAGFQRRLAECARQAREYRDQAEKARIAERQALAGDIHDGPLQGFISLQLRLEVLRKLMQRDPETAARELQSLQEMCRSLIAEMRGFLRGVRPVEVGEAGLVASLRQAVAEFQKHSGIEAAFENHGTPVVASPEASLEIVQIVREALNNIQKHSKATHVAVTLHASRGQLEISIEDNGVGFPFSGTYTLEELELLRMGPSSIQRRVRTLAGKLVLESRPQRGSALTVRIPA